VLLALAEASFLACGAEPAPGPLRTHLCHLVFQGPWLRVLAGHLLVTCRGIRLVRSTPQKVHAGLQQHSHCLPSTNKRVARRCPQLMSLFMTILGHSVTMVMHVLYWATWFVC